MPIFVNVLLEKRDEKFSKAEILQALQQNMAFELEGMSIYEAHMFMIEDPLVKKVLEDIRNEMIEHCGRLLTVIRYLNPDIEAPMLSGEKTVKSTMQHLGISSESAPPALQIPQEAEFEDEAAPNGENLIKLFFPKRKSGEMV